MAKNRDERYRRTEDMLEDLQAVRAGQPPTHAKRQVDLESLAKLEETGKTVDITPANGSPFDLWANPIVIGLIIAGGVSILINLILIVLFLTRS